MSRNRAILTGDLIQSTRSTSARLAGAMEVIRAIAEEISPDSRFTRFRGDGWQIQLTDPGDSLRAALLILAALQSRSDLPRSRIAVGIGTGQVPGPDLSDAGGPGFVASGQALDTMGRREVLALAPQGSDPFQRLCFAFAGDRAAGWTSEQAEAMVHALGADGPRQEDIAERLGITRQAVGLRLRGAGHARLTEAIAAVRHAFSTKGKPK